MLRDPFRFYQVPPPAPTYFGGTLPTVNVRASYPDDYVANAVRLGGSKFLGTALGFMGQPQRDMVELFTGVEQTPSEAMGISNPVAEFLINSALDPLNAVGLTSIGGAMMRSSMRNPFRAFHLRNAYNLIPEGSFSGYSKLRNADKSYRVAGMDAYNDFVESGVLRSKTPDMPVGASLEERIIGARPTGFPSFQKGFADLRYLPDNGGVVFETGLPTFKRGEINPVTGQRIKGRHYAHRVIDPNTGATMSSIPGENISVYGSSPHWLKGYPRISVPSPGKFKSEIDWGKWNPDTPKYPELINEYNAIEESTKKAGTWMKNADGSPFKGLPEQFIQQQSSWHKKAFKNPVRERRPDFFSDEILGGQDPKNYFDKNMPIQFNYHSSPNEFDFFDENLFSTGAFGKAIYTTRLPQNMYGKHLYQLYLNANNPQPYSYTRFVTKNGSEVAERVNDPKLVHERTFYQQLEPGRDYFNPAEESSQSLVPFSNYPKSAIGNVGFFDMTNPNIYKSMMPLGAIYGGRNYYRDK
jgi:hypothetical protein